MRYRYISALFLLITMSVIASCGTAKTDGDNTNSGDISKAIGDTILIVLKTGDNMKFDNTELRVPDGKIVKLTLEHSGQMPMKSMGHNFVLLQSGINVAEFGAAVSTQAKAPDYNIPASLMGNVIANTKMIGGGESATIEFHAPKKGSYDFICSFPGHYSLMKGVFIVE